VGAIAGFLVGYYLGTRDGREGFQRLVESWNYVSQTDEFKSLMATVVPMAQDLARRGLTQGLAGSLMPDSKVVPALAEGVVDLLARRRAA
jgi:hypothetical protein